MKNGPPTIHRLAFCAGLALLTFLLFRPVLQHDFVNYDDPDYVTANPQVQSGMTVASARWALTTGHVGNWHPLTWLSHQADVECFGDKPFGHHLTSLLLHCANVMLLFLFLQMATGSRWRSALVALLFAVHPLRVESVAWISERKDVLCGFFCLLALLAYARHARQRILPSPPRSGKFPSPRRGEGGRRSDEVCPGDAPSLSLSVICHPLSSSWYWLALVFFAFALMSKPMAVTLPFVLLLLDVWPLNRLRMSRGWPQASITRSVLLEKIPFFALAIASCIVTFVVQQRGGAMTGEATFSDRVANALVAYARYLGKSVWPEPLAVFYPYPASWPSEWIAGGALLLAVFSLLALKKAQTNPALGVGWFWFAGMLVPTIGLVQVGGQSMADRYTYLPHIGLFIACVFAWPAGKLSQQWRMLLAVVSIASVSAFAWQTSRQIAHWHDSESLFRHAIAVTTRNEVAHNNLGAALQKRGEWKEAAAQHAAAIGIKSKYAGAHMNLGNCLLKLGEHDRALDHLRRALDLEPNAEAHYNLGTSLMELKRPGEAITSLRRAVELRPDQPEARLNLGIASLALGDFDLATNSFQAALALQPEMSAAWLQLGNARVRQTNYLAAADAFAMAAKLDPQDTTALFNLANAYIELGKISEAIITLGQLIAIRADDLESRRLLAGLHMRVGDFASARSQFDFVVRSAPDPVAHLELAQCLLALGHRSEAVVQYRASLALQPRNAAALNDLAWLLATDAEATARNGTEAVALAEQACDLTQRRNPLLLGTLAAAYAEAGRFPEAVATAESAIALARSANLAPVVERNEELLKLYRASKPFHEPAHGY